MIERKSLLKLLLICFVLSGVFFSLKAGYYEPDLFPIGLTGINGTGGNPPYSNVPGENWKWTPQENQDQNEQDLIFDLGINCIGCQDAQACYVGYVNPNYVFLNNYIHKVCEPSFDPNDDIDSIFVITVSYYVRNDVNDSAPGAIFKSCYSDDCADTCYDSTGYSQYVERHADAMFRSPTRGNHKGYGDIQFSHYGGSGSYNCHGTQVDNWETFDGEDTWRAQADSAISNFKGFLRRSDSVAPYIWGYNLISEDPALYRGIGWHGCWAAVDYVFTGHGYDDASKYNYFRDLVGEPGYDLHNQSLGGMRGIEDSCLQGTLQGARRMFVAKGALWGLHKRGQDIFEALPDIDVFVDFWHSWCRAEYNYGEQGVFDNLLYCPENEWGTDLAGYHNDAVYFQKYANNHLAYSDQKRRWVPWIALEWLVAHDGTSDDYTKAKVRRPCPPEIRCAAYLLMSRGAKGILFHGWSFSLTYDHDKDGKDGTPYITKRNPIVDIPSSYTGSGYYNVGIRDQQGYPYDGSLAHHVLNDSTAPAGKTQTHWHNNNEDYTYDYLCELIPELKKITPILVHLDWVNAYSLKSTVSGKSSPCPHMYVKDITTNREGYIDLAFFDHPDESSSEYFMVVNRDGIAENVNCTLIIQLDGELWSTYPQSMIVKDMADTTDTFGLTPSNDFKFTDIYEPGEGKLYRVRSETVQTDSIARMLWLNGKWKASSIAEGYMEPLSGDNTYGLAYCTWRWVSDKPATLEDMCSWERACGESSWNAGPPDWLMDFDLDWGTFVDAMGDSCMYYVELGTHPDGEDTINDSVGTKSNEVQVVYPGSPPSGCPDLFSFFYQDTNIQPGHVFMENNTILPHSQHYQAIDEDLLKLDVLNTDPDHYYLSIVENSNSTSYLDQARLWVVDHPANTGIVTSADDSIYVYSDMVGPASCTDRRNNDRLDQILWEDTSSFAGPAGSYLTVKFSDPGWSNAGLLISLGDRSETAPPPKDYLSIPSEPGGGGTWDSLGVAYGRMNPSQWLVDVSDCDSFTFRVYCYGSDTCFIDRIALVKLESTGWSMTEADLDLAVKWVKVGDGYDSSSCINELVAQDTLADTLSEDEQLSLRFDKVDTSTTYSARDFVFQSRGYYYSPLLQKSGIEEVPLEFGLEVQQIAPLSRAAHISYSVPYAINVKIGVYDVAGRLVKSIVNGKVKPGKYCEEWQGKDNVGRTLASGVYFVKMMTEDFEKTDKIVILE